MQLDEYKVGLPPNLWEKATSEQHLNELILKYMERYPHYDVIGVSNGFAICIRK